MEIISVNTRLTSSSFKRLLLGTFILQSSVSYSSEQAPSLTISGEGRGVGYFFKQTQREQNGGRGNGQFVRIETTRLNFDIFGKTNNWGGIEYSFLVGIAGNTAAGQNAVEEARVKFKSTWGTVLIGTHRGVDHVMPYGSFMTAGGTGGAFDGNYTNAINLPTDTNSGVDMIGTVKNTNRITYATPRVAVFSSV